MIKAYYVSGIKCYGTPGKLVCWTKQTHYGMSDGGGVQDQACWQVVQQAVQRQHQKLLPTQEPIKLLSLAEPQDLDPQIDELLAAVHGILNHSKPDMAKDCWLCLHPGPIQHLALPLTNFTKTFTMTNSDAASTTRSSRLNSVQLAYKAPECYFNNGTNPLEGNLTIKQCIKTSHYMGLGCQPTQGCCSNNRTYFVCGEFAYQCLPTGWAELCALAYLIP